MIKAVFMCYWVRRRKYFQTFTSLCYSYLVYFQKHWALGIPYSNLILDAPYSSHRVLLCYLFQFNRTLQSHWIVHFQSRSRCQFLQGQTVRFNLVLCYYDHQFIHWNEGPFNRWNELQLLHLISEFQYCQSLHSYHSCDHLVWFPYLSPLWDRLISRGPQHLT